MARPKLPARLIAEVLAVVAVAEGFGLLLAWQFNQTPGALSVAALQGASAAFLLAPLALWRVWRRMRQVGRDEEGAVLVDLEDEQAAALAVTTALARAVDVSEAAEVVNDALRNSTGLDRSAVLLYQADGVCRFVGWRNLSAEYRRAVEGHCPWKEGASEATPIVVPNARHDAGLEPYRDLLEREGIAALVFVPVEGKNGVVGKLMLYGSDPGRIPPSAVRAAQVIAVSLGETVTRLRMAEALARSESRLRAVIDTAMDAVVSMDGEGRIASWNVQAEATFGWTAKEVLGRPLVEVIIPPELRVAHVEGLARYRATGASQMLGRRIEVQALRKDGKRITAELAVTRVRSADGVLFSGFLRDITDKKRAAEELVEARAAAEAANRAKSEFLANMSHEIRTPLTAILGYTEMLRDDGDLARAPERRLDTIDTITGAGQHLLTILNDILDISKIEAGKMTVETVATPLLQILREVESLMRPRAIEKGVALEARLAGELPETIHGDPTRLRQILVNLVGNAVKFTEGGHIRLVARALDQGHGLRLQIEVEDTGPGLSPEQIARLFSPFGQADASVTRRHGGSGLGLSISNRLAQLLGGSVALVRTELGRGSTFRLDLPLRALEGTPWCTSLDAPPPRAPLPQPKESVRLSGRVLLAEDGRDNQVLVSFHLKRAGAEVDVAANGVAALELLERAEAEERPYDLLLTDIQMPEMDGFTLTRTLRARGNRIAIVALTAHAMAEDRDRCLAAGCDDYAVKPIDRSRLLATCARWMGAGALRG